MDELTNGVELHEQAPATVPGRYVGHVVQKQLEAIIARSRAVLVASPSQLLTRSYDTYIFGWSPFDGSYEIREDSTKKLLFHSRRAGRDIVKCEVDPMVLEEVLSGMEDKGE